METKPKKLKKRYLFSIVVLLIIVAAIICFICFTQQGYMFSIGFRGFDEVRDNIYVDETYESGNTEQLLALLDEAELRVSEFWGGLEAEPVVIVSDNTEKLAKLGYTGSPALTNTFLLFGAHSFVVISPNGVGVDVLAHELTHAELHKRLYNGKLLYKQLVPIWFDEGVATQNDYRRQYNNDAWNKATDNGSKSVDFSTIEQPSQFYSSDTDEKIYNYIVSRHELSEWLDRNGKPALIDLIAEINSGAAFDDVYYKER